MTLLTSASVTPTGLTAQQVADRVTAGETNHTRPVVSRTVSDIIRANVLTRFNALLGMMVVIILAVGSIKDAVFGLVLIANVVIGVTQEWRAKQTLDRLSVLITSDAIVMRDGTVESISPGDIVRGDVVQLTAGGQVLVDGPVVASAALEVDESLLTGEAEPIRKAVGDRVLSGSLVVAGSGWQEAEYIGTAAYATRLAAAARQFAPTQSELRRSIDTLLRAVTWAIVPIAALLLFGQRSGGESWKSALAGTVSGVVGMIPEGLILLTSIALATSVMRLGKRSVLVTELSAVEALARTDVVCFDKTGTLTDGTMAFAALDILDGSDPALIYPILAAVGRASGSNATATELAKLHPEPTVILAAAPFSSARKWSAAILPAAGGRPSGAWIVGAPEIIAPSDTDVVGRSSALAAAGQRVVLLAYSKTTELETELPDQRCPVALVRFTERIRADASETIAYLTAQDIRTMIISGDNPVTVAALATTAGVPGLDRPGAIVDARNEGRDWSIVTESAQVIGRSNPSEKIGIVQAMQKNGHIVAMTGDGINDALAIKSADLGIAMGSGTAATRSVAAVVLIDGKFSSIPVIIDEGRRVIANVERVAKLFLTKTVYAAVLAVATGIAGFPFPFLPRHLTLVSSLTIGIPGFFLALATDAPRAQPGFLRRVARFTVPAGLVAAIATFVSYATALREDSLGVAVARTNATLVLLIVTLWLVAILARPLRQGRLAMLLTLVTLAVTSFAVRASRRYFDLHLGSPAVLAEAALIALAAAVLIEGGWRLASHFANGSGDKPMAGSRWADGRSERVDR